MWAQLIASRVRADVDPDGIVPRLRAAQEALRATRAAMVELFEGAPEFTDLAVVDEWAD